MTISVFLCSFIVPLAAVVAGVFADDEDITENAPAAVQETTTAEKQFYARMFSGDSGSFADTVDARKHHDALLRQKIAIVDRICGLSNSQKEKLELAGRGDIKRLFDRVEEVGRQFQRVKDDRQEVESLYEELEPLRRCIRRPGLTNDDSLFVKFLEKILSAEQYSRYEPLRLVICAGGEVRARHADSKDVLEIDVRGTPFGDDGLARLSELTNILVLRLDRTRVTDAGLAHLKGLAIIQLLELADVNVTDAGLAHLTGLTSMTMLVLRSTQVSDAGVAHLKAMNSLYLLSLEGTQVTDVGLTDLREMNSLRMLHLGRTRVTDVGIAELQRALPMVMIDK